MPSLPLLRLLLFVLLSVERAHCAGQRRRAKPPIVGESDKNQVSVRSNQCSFGNETFEIDDKWKPDLGPPVGVLFCVRCECVAANRKSRLVARVKCRNIKHDCPKPACEDAVVLPGRCCKTCQGQTDAVAEDSLAGRKIARKGEQGRQIYSMVGRPGAQASASAPLPPSEAPAREQRAPNASVVSAAAVMDEQEANDLLTSSHKCYYEGNIFEDGSQWKAQHQDCQMCSCQVCSRAAASHRLTVLAGIAAWTHQVSRHALP